MLRKRNSFSRETASELEEYRRQFMSLYVPYTRRLDVLNGAIVGAPADPEAFG